jgi:hypothetical protein
LETWHGKTEVLHSAFSYGILGANMKNEEEFFKNFLSGRTDSAIFIFGWMPR